MRGAQTPGPALISPMRGRATDAGSRDGRQRWPDHRRTERGRIVSGVRRQYGARPERTDHCRHQQARGAGYAGDPHRVHLDLWRRRQREPDPDRRAQIPHRPTHAPHARPPPPARRRIVDGNHRRPDRLRAPHRVMDGGGVLAPKVIRPDWRGADRPRGRRPGVLIRRARPEWHQLVSRPEPIPREVDDVGGRVDLCVVRLPRGPVVFFHRFADLL